MRGKWTLDERRLWLLLLRPLPADAAAEVEPEPTRRNMPKNRGRVRVGVVGLIGDVSSLVFLVLWLLPLPGGVVGLPLLSEPIFE